MAYSYLNRINALIKRVENSDIREDNKKKILEFDRENIARGLSASTRFSYMISSFRLAKLVNKPFMKMSKEDILKFIPTIKASQRTLDMYQLSLKRFFRWLNGDEEFPECVRWIKRSRNNMLKLPEELLTEEEVKAIASKADNLRDRALVMVLYESACRIGELLSLKIKHIYFGKNFTTLIVNGKTGMRKVWLINSTPDLSLWYNHHPNKDNPEAPLWMTMGNNYYGGFLGKQAVAIILQKLAKKAEIKKRIYPHLFRHSRLTQLAKMFTESELKIIAGWGGDSRMPKIYIHLSGADIEQKLLRIHGLLEEEKPKEEVLKPRKCPRCGTINPPTFKFCGSCAMALDLKTVMELEDKRKKADEKMSLLVQKYPELRELIEKLLEKEI